MSFAKSISDEAEQQFRLAQKLEEEGNTFQAITEYERFLYFLPGHPKSPSVLYRLIRCRYKMREWSKAIEEAKNFEKKYPENPLLLPVKVLLLQFFIESGSLQKGTFWGSMLTVDRLIHEASEAKHAPFIVINGQKKIYDPLWANDFLLRKPKETSKKGGGKIHDLQ